MAVLNPLSEPLVRDGLLILGVAGLIIPAFHRLRLSPVVGFILFGTVVGPHGLGALGATYPWLNHFTITDGQQIAVLAEIGVALLLFTIGLELSFERLRAMRALVFGLGAAQLAVSATLIFGILLLLGVPLVAAGALGLGLALSSTAIVLNILASEHRLLTRVGRTAFAILIFQDLAIAPILFFFSTLSAKGGSLTELLTQLALGAGSIAAILLAGRFLLRPMLRQAVRAGGSELFLSTCLVIVIGASAITAAAGLSMLIGALIAGLLIAETEYHRQVHVAVEPFQGLMLGVFLISIGMSLDIELLAERPLHVLAAVIGLLAVKGLAIAAILKLSGRARGETVHTALLMASSSETSMILITAALGFGLVPRDIGGFALLVTAITLTLLPFLARVGHQAEKADRAVPATPAPEPREGAVIVLGYGRVGQLATAMLDAHDIPWIALDGDPDVVEAARRHGKPVEMGDGQQIGLLEKLDAGSARALVVTLDRPAIAEHIVGEARRRWPDLIIVARARDAEAAARLYKAGATDAVPETVESSLQLSEAVLVDIGCKTGPVIASIHAKREELRNAIKAMLPEGAPEPTLGRRRPSRAANEA